MVVIKNVVATAHLNVALDLHKLEAALPMALYLPHRFSGLLVRILSPQKAHVQIYSNGKMTVNGGRSVRDAFRLACRFATMVRQQGYLIRLTDFKVVNFVGCFDMQRRLPLESISKDLNVLYEPEIFSGLAIRLSTCTAVIFHSGKVNLLGARSEDELMAGECELRFLLPDYLSVSSDNSTG